MTPNMIIVLIILVFISSFLFYKYMIPKEVISHNNKYKMMPLCVLVGFAISLIAYSILCFICQSITFTIN
jgi:uncharacterized membrane protein